MGIRQLVSSQAEKTEETVKTLLVISRQNDQAARKMQKCFRIMLTGKYFRNIGLNPFFCVSDIGYHKSVMTHAVFIHFFQTARAVI